MNPYVVPLCAVEMEDYVDFIIEMREADKMEIAALSGDDAETFAQRVLLDHVEDPIAHPTFALMHPEGSPMIALFGHSRVETEVSVSLYSPWMVATPALAEFPVYMHRGFREHVDRLQGPHFWAGLVDLRNSLHIHWLEALDFDLDKEHFHIVGRDGKPFRSFTREPRHV